MKRLKTAVNGSERHEESLVGKRLVPATVVAAIFAFAVGQLNFGLALDHPQLWRAALALVILSGITPLIYAVNLRIVPVFSRRTWPSPRLLPAAILASLAGGWLVYLGRATFVEPLEILGSTAALLGGIHFLAAIMRLFRSPAKGGPAPPLPFPEQAAIDRIGTRFMGLAGVYLLFGLAVGLLLTIWTPQTGRWELVWAHAMLLGWFLTMAAGVCYHVLPRWTSVRWSDTRRIRAHLYLVEGGLPLMILALALNLRWLFFVAGPIQTVAVLLFIWNILPAALALPRVTRLGLAGAALMLGIGVSIGASMAMDPVRHAILRQSHAEINVFGWTGLLISSIGYYLFPRFAGQPLRWPRLGYVQLAALALGVATSAPAWWWYLSFDPGARWLILAGSLLSTGSFALFGLNLAATFYGSRQGLTRVTLQPRTASSSRGG